MVVHGTRRRGSVLLPGIRVRKAFGGLGMDRHLRAAPRKEAKCSQTPPTRSRPVIRIMDNRTVGR